MNITCLNNIAELYQKKEQERNDILQKALNHPLEPFLSLLGLVVTAVFSLLPGLALR